MSLPRVPLVLLLFCFLVSSSRNAHANDSFFTSIGTGVYSRSFRFTDVDAETELAPLSVPTAPLVYGRLEFSPPFGVPGLAPLRFGGQFNAVLPVALRSASGRSAYEAFEFRTQLGYVLSTGKIALEPRVGYHVTSAGSAISGSEVRFPALRYDFLEGGLSLRHESEATFLEVSLAYGVGVTFGPLRSVSWFDHVSALSLQGVARFGLLMSADVGLVVGAELSQIGLDFNPLSRVMPLEERAGGATDRALVFTLGPYFTRSKTRASRASNLGDFD